MNYKNTICFIVPSLQMGGMERVVSLLSNYSVENGFDVYIICLIRNKAAYELNKNISIISPPFNYNGGGFGKIQVFYHLLSSLKKIKPDVAISFSEVFNPLSILAARILAVPIFISDRSSPSIKLRFTVETLRKLVYPLAKGMISQTKFAKDSASRKKYNTNISVIPNPLRTIDDTKNSIKKNVIISVGRLVATKNFKELIDIFFEVDTNEEWELWILGDGPEKNILQQQIDSYNISNRVKLFGAVNDVDYYLSKASIFAFTSISEGFPNVLSEAIAYPLPCIAYDCTAGPADLIKDGENGFLIPLYNKERFKNDLKILMLNPLQRNNFVKDYQRHRDKYDAENISKKYISFLLD